MKKVVDSIKGLMILIVIGWIVIVYNSSNNSNQSIKNDSHAVQLTSTVSKPPELVSCKTDWHKCDTNEDLVNDSFDWSMAQVNCKYSANDQARYGSPIWPWLPFSHFTRGNDYAKTGRAILVEPDAQFQNGYGAMAHVRVVCIYNLEKKEVISVTITDR